MNSCSRCFFYFRDPKYLPPNVVEDDKPLYQAESSEAARRMTDLKTRIRKSKCNLADKYGNAQQFAAAVWQDLKQAIEIDCPPATQLNPLDVESDFHKYVAGNFCLAISGSIKSDGFSRVYVTR